MRLHNGRDFFDEITIPLSDDQTRRLANGVLLRASSTYDVPAVTGNQFVNEAVVSRVAGHELPVLVLTPLHRKAARRFFLQFSGQYLFGHDRK